MTPNNTSANTIKEIFELQKANRIKLAETSADQRKEKLDKLLKTILNSQDEICEAVYKDLHKSKEETKLTEIFSVTSEIKFVKRSLSKWMRPKRVSTPITLFGATSKIIYESIGQSLIISPWNYPFQLAIGPLVSAIAAGNVVMIKPSEKSPNTSALLERMLNNLFHKDEVRVFLGDADVAKELTSLPFNHIFFTGNPEIGKLVMGAASKNLTKVTLELGGKSPSILNKDADIKTSAKRIAWGKFLNAGQTCIAPDYLIVHNSIKEKLIEELKNAITDLYGKENLNAPDHHYPRMIDENQLQSVSELLEDAKANGAKVIHGGGVVKEDKYISPTIIDNIKLDSKIMETEIFGPLLPILSFEAEDEIIAITEKNPNPLALYIFSNDKSFVKKILKKIPAGGSAVNDVVVHFANHNLPFGGINRSGIGKAHGQEGFKAFSNAKSLMKQSKLSSLKFFYPPYNNLKGKLIDLIIKYF